MHRSPMLQIRYIFLLNFIEEDYSRRNEACNGKTIISLGDQNSFNFPYHILCARLAMIHINED